MRTFAIGDIHGCRALLADLLAQIDREADGDPHRIVCLGDYVDRGPDSAGVVALLRERERAAGEDAFVCLKGNHEDMLVGATTRSDMERVWLGNGGADTLASYRVTTVRDLPPDVLTWFASLRTVFEDERRCYVHAGLNPDFPRDQQTDEDRLWIRKPFLRSEHDFGRYVVHGHTPLRKGVPEVHRTRANLDTAAVYGGRLTAAVFDDGRDPPVGFLQSR